MISLKILISLEMIFHSGAIGWVSHDLRVCNFFAAGVYTLIIIAIIWVTANLRVRRSRFLLHTHFWMKQKSWMLWFRGFRFHFLLSCISHTRLSVVKFCKCAHLITSVVYTPVIQAQSVMTIRIGELRLVVLHTFIQFHSVSLGHKTKSWLRGNCN